MSPKSDSELTVARGRTRRKHADKQSERLAVWRGCCTVMLLGGFTCLHTGPGVRRASAAEPAPAPALEPREMPLIFDPTIRGVDEPRMWVADEFIVVFHRHARGELRVSTDRRGGVRVNFPELQKTVDGQKVIRLARQFPTADPRPETSRYPDLTGHYKVRLPAGADLEQAMAAFVGLGIVERVEKIGVHFVNIDPNDPWYKDPPPSFDFDQWHYWDTFGIAADLAWDIQTGRSDVVVAVADTGVRYFHIDLGGPNATWGPDDPKSNGNIWNNPGEVPGDGVDNDGNGYIDDTTGFDFVSSTAAVGCSCLDQDCGTADNDPDDGDGHGTHIAGTIGAITHNARVGAGVAGGFSNGATTGPGNGVRIMPLRVGWRARCAGVTTGIVRMDYAAAAFQYIADQVQRGVNVAAVNCSWGSSNSGGLGAATSNLIAHDVMIVVAAGNENSTSTGFLGGRSDTIAVAATTRNGTGASFSNHGSTVDVAAPGVTILSTFRNPDDPDPNNHYLAVLSGTSMSAPHVAGIAALLESCEPNLTRLQKTSRILSTATPYTDSRDLGSGIANARLALDGLACGSPPDCNTDADCDDGDVCTTDTCSDGTCSQTPIDCDDGNACTDDFCDASDPQADPQGCVTLPEDQSTPCEADGDLCTIDRCDGAGGCIGFDNVDCSHLDDQCEVGVCDPASGECETEPAAFDTPCEADGDLCTIDRCESGGVCATADGVDCSHLNDECHQGVCDPGTGSCGLAPRVESPTQNPGAVPMNRYLSFEAANEGQPTAVRITFESLPPPFDVHNGATAWVSTPQALSLAPNRDFSSEVDPDEPHIMAAQIQCEPLWDDWSQYGEVFVYDLLIVPGGTVAVEQILEGCDPDVPASFSQPLFLTTGRFGDITGPFADGWPAPDGVAQVATDVLAMIDAMLGKSAAPFKPRVDLVGFGSPAVDGALRIGDALLGIDAALGRSFPFTSPVPPCP